MINIIIRNKFHKFFTKLKESRVKGLKVSQLSKNMVAFDIRLRIINFTIIWKHLAWTSNFFFENVIPHWSLSDINDWFGWLM